MKRLYDVTNSDSGIIIYPDGTVICHNWHAEEGLPKISPIGVPVMWPGEFELVASDKITNCQAELPETEYAYITEEDFADLQGQPGQKYILKAGEEELTVIHPETWR